MKRVIALCAFSLLSCTKPRSNTSAKLWVTGYYPAYETDTMMPLSATPFDGLTHVVHFSLVPNADGTLADPNGLLSQTFDLVSAAHAAGVKALLGIGGDTGSGATAGFQAAAQNATRPTLVANIVAAMNDGGYDGVDINWESIRFPTDQGNLQALIEDLYAALGGKLLTYPAQPPSSGDDGSLADALWYVQEKIDQINLQTYVMSGPFPGWVPWFNSPLAPGACVFPSTLEAPPSIDRTVQGFLFKGIDPKRLGIGIQLAAVDWRGGSGTSTGGVTAPCQAWDMSATAPDGQDIGAPDYSQVNFVSAAFQTRNFTEVNGYVPHFDDSAKAPWLSNDQAANSNDHFVSYEDATSIAAKGDYIRNTGLGGTIVFDVTGDYLFEKPAGDAQHPLMSAVRDSIKRP